MASVERIHESAEILPGTAELKRRAVDGWRLVALVWEREVGPGGAPLNEFEDIPFGLQISEDCQHLVDNPAEKQILMMAMDLICEDKTISQVSEALNAKGQYMRNGGKWTPAAVFQLLPRLIDTGPRIFTSKQWIDRKMPVRA
ncbi:MAG TPA: hypothetical protein VKU01_05015 [Bryobacteraceae bacterium]|nr:hypothetical protein [Bryobacteraceae bacterium]